MNELIFFSFSSFFEWKWWKLSKVDRVQYWTCFESCFGFFFFFYLTKPNKCECREKVSEFGCPLNTSLNGNYYCYYYHWTTTNIITITITISNATEIIDFLSSPFFACNSLSVVYVVCTARCMIIYIWGSWLENWRQIDGELKLLDNDNRDWGFWLVVSRGNQMQIQATNRKTEKIFCSRENHQWLSLYYRYSLFIG